MAVSIDRLERPCGDLRPGGEQAGSSISTLNPSPRGLSSFTNRQKEFRLETKDRRLSHEPEDKPSSENCDGDFPSLQYWREPIAEVPLDFDVEDLENLVETMWITLFQKLISNLEALFGE